MPEDLQIALAEERHNELRAQLERLRPGVLARWRAGRLALDDLEKVMVLDADIERAAADLRALMLREG